MMFKRKPRIVIFGRLGGILGQFKLSGETQSAFRAASCDFPFAPGVWYDKNVFHYEELPREKPSA